MSAALGKDGFIVKNIQKCVFDFYVSIAIIFPKPLEKSLRIMYNI